MSLLHVQMHNGKHTGGTQVKGQENDDRVVSVSATHMR